MEGGKEREEASLRDVLPGKDRREKKGSQKSSKSRKGEKKADLSKKGLPLSEDHREGHQEGKVQKKNEGGS